LTSREQSEPAIVDKAKVIKSKSLKVSTDPDLVSVPIRTTDKKEPETLKLSLDIFPGQTEITVVEQNEKGTGVTLISEPFPEPEQDQKMNIVVLESVLQEVQSPGTQKQKDGGLSDVPIKDYVPKSTPEERQTTVEGISAGSEKSRVQVDVTDSAQDITRKKVASVILETSEVVIQTSDISSHTDTESTSILSPGMVCVVATFVEPSDELETDTKPVEFSVPPSSFTMSEAPQSELQEEKHTLHSADYIDELWKSSPEIQSRYLVLDEPEVRATVDAKEKKKDEQKDKEQKSEDGERKEVPGHQWEEVQMRVECEEMSLPISITISPDQDRLDTQDFAPKKKAVDMEPAKQTETAVLDETKLITTRQESKSSELPKASESVATADYVEPEDPQYTETYLSTEPQIHQQTQLPLLQPTETPPKTDHIDELRKNSSEVQNRYLVLDVPEVGVTQMQEIKPDQIKEKDDHSQQEKIAGFDSAQVICAVSAEAQPCETKTEWEKLTLSDQQKVELKEAESKLEVPKTTEEKFKELKQEKAATGDLIDETRSLDEMSVSKAEVKTRAEVPVSQLHVSKDQHEHTSVRTVTQELNKDQAGIPHERGPESKDLTHADVQAEKAEIELSVVKESSTGSSSEPSVAPETPTLRITIDAKEKKEEEEKMEEKSEDWERKDVHEEEQEPLPAMTTKPTDQRRVDSKDLPPETKSKSLEPSLDAADVEPAQTKEELLCSREQKEAAMVGETKLTPTRQDSMGAEPPSGLKSISAGDRSTDLKPEEITKQPDSLKPASSQEFVTLLTQTVFVEENKLPSTEEKSKSPAHFPEVANDKTREQNAESPYEPSVFPKAPTDKPTTDEKEATEHEQREKEKKMEGWDLQEGLTEYFLVVKTMVEGFPTQENRVEAAADVVTTEKPVLEGPEGPTMKDIFSEIELLAETGWHSPLTEGKPLKDAPQALVSAFSDLEARLSRLVTKVLSCKNRLAELNPAMMARQVEEAE
ncbi:hypothetical protein LDENG_00280030, partial [Lucifuga dentata]